jgi:hypothetical protein
LIAGLTRANPNKYMKEEVLQKEHYKKDNTKKPRYKRLTVTKDSPLQKTHRYKRLTVTKDSPLQKTHRYKRLTVTKDSLQNPHYKTPITKPPLQKNITKPPFEKEHYKKKNSTNRTLQQSSNRQTRTQRAKEGVGRIVGYIGRGSQILETSSLQQYVPESSLDFVIGHRYRE